MCCQRRSLKAAEREGFVVVVIRSVGLLSWDVAAVAVAFDGVEGFDGFFEGTNELFGIVRVEEVVGEKSNGFVGLFCVGH